MLFITPSIRNQRCQLPHQIVHDFRDMTLYEVPKEKKNFLDGEVVIHVSGFGIYPDIYELEQAGTGEENL